MLVSTASENTPPYVLHIPGDLIEKCRILAQDLDGYVTCVAQNLPEKQTADNQFIFHGYAWAATLAAAVHALVDWAVQLQNNGKLDRLEQMILAAGCVEYLDQIVHGIALSQDEVFRPRHVNLIAEASGVFDRHSELCTLDIRMLGQAIVREVTSRDSIGHRGLDDTLSMIVEQFRSFSDEKIAPNAQAWHTGDLLIPDSLIAELAELGVFGMTISEKYGGIGMGKLAMCVVTEELSRGYIGVGSLGTRAEIAGELILQNGTDAQKETFLPGIANGTILPAAVFTEPENGSDLARLRTRAQRHSSGWSLKGQKTWITHAARADLMTVLARSNPEEAGHRGLSLFLLRKRRGTVETPFPDDGIAGEEIEVLGYRGMKEYTVAFDNVDVASDALLGMEEGRGFAQLMSTFEGARIQTAARAVGVAENAFDLALAYARDRVQFGRNIVEFQRVYGKLARMVVDIAASRQLTYASARAKDEGRRCDIEAGMAKLLAARTAWACADNGLQIHGGNGYAIEYPISRVLCDARILNIFEGAAEIQAEVIARGLSSARPRNA